MTAPTTRPALPPALSDLFSQMQQGHGLSWTFSPAITRRQIRPYLEGRRVKIVERTFEGDTQVYKFVVLTPAGEQLMKGVK